MLIKYSIDSEYFLVYDTLKEVSEMLMTAQHARELATLANNELNKLVTIEEKLLTKVRCIFVIIAAFLII